MKTLGNDSRKGLGHRLAIIEGHLRKVRQMVDGGDQCLDVIHQSRAIQQALKKFDEQVLQEHLSVCVKRDSKLSTPEKVADHIIQAFQKL